MSAPSSRIVGTIVGYETVWLDAHRGEVWARVDHDRGEARVRAPIRREVHGERALVGGIGVHLLQVGEGSGVYALGRGVGRPLGVMANVVAPYGGDDRYAAIWFYAQLVRHDRHGHARLMVMGGDAQEVRASLPRGTFVGAGEWITCRAYPSNKSGLVRLGAVQVTDAPRAAS